MPAHSSRSRQGFFPVSATRPPYLDRLQQAAFAFPSPGLFASDSILTFPAAIAHTSHLPTNLSSRPPNVRLWKPSVGHACITSTSAYATLHLSFSAAYLKVEFAESTLHLAISSPRFPQQSFAFTAETIDLHLPAPSVQSPPLPWSCMIKAANFAFPSCCSLSTVCSRSGFFLAIWNVP